MNYSMFVTKIYNELWKTFAYREKKTREKEISN